MAFGYAENLTVTGTINNGGVFKDSTGSAGVGGQVLSSTVTGTQWVAASGGGSSAYRKSSGVWINVQASTGGLKCIATGGEWPYTSSGEGTAFGANSLTFGASKYAIGPYLQYVHGGGDPDVGSGIIGQVKAFCMGWNLNLTTEIGLVLPSPSSLFTDCRFWAGLFSDAYYFGQGGQPIQNVGGTDTPGILQSSYYIPFAAFRFCNTSGGLTDTNFMAVTCDGVGPSPSYTVVDTGVTPALAPSSSYTSAYKFAINFDDTDGNVKFYINGALVATISTTLPTGNGTNNGYMGYLATCGYHTATGFGMNLCGWEVQSDY
jgi:hypothetical protein